MTIHYREGRVEDFNSILELYKEGMNLEAFTDATSEAAQIQMIKIFLANDFAAANHFTVAECDNDIAGVLIGSSKLDKHKVIKTDMNPIKEQARQQLAKLDEGPMALSDMQKKHHMMAQDNAQDPEELYDGELIFFCTSKKHQRKGIGSRLVAIFEEYLERIKANSYFLYTDTLCSYQYYEMNGFDRVQEKKNLINPSVAIFVYKKELPL